MGSTYEDDDSELEYHQDYYNETRKSTITIYQVAITLILLFVAYQTFFRLNFDTLPTRQFLWNWLVYLTPYRLLEWLDGNDSLASLVHAASDQSAYAVHTRKSEKMRRLLGLEQGARLMETVAQAGRRKFSLLPGRSMSFEKENVPPGLGNRDNSCYQNSVLQGLASLDSFSEYLVDPKIQLDAGNDEEVSDMPMASSLKQLISQLRDPANNGKQLWTPPTLKNMSSRQQQDAQEYFSKLLDEVDKEVATAIGHAAVAASDVGAHAANKDRQGSIESTVSVSTTRNPLEGLIATRTGCTVCGHSEEGLRMIPFNCLTVPIGRREEYDVAECLDVYTTLEDINGVECGKCTLSKNQSLLTKLIERVAASPGAEDQLPKLVHRLAAVTKALEEDDYEEKTIRDKCEIAPRNRVTVVKSQQSVVARPPKSLAIHVNRSLYDENTGEFRKNYAELRFPKILNLGPWCLGSNSSRENIEAEKWELDPTISMIASSSRPCRLKGPIYELRAVVTHQGRHENGHYICYRKNPAADEEVKHFDDDAWWRLSDEDVTIKTEEEVLSQGGVFMLFYDRISVNPLLCNAENSPVSISESVKASLEEIRSFAAEIPLPGSPVPSEAGDEEAVEDSRALSNETGPPDTIPMSRDNSQASTNSGDDHDNETEETYPFPAQPILIKPFIQPHGFRENKEDGALTGKSSLSSSSRTSSLVMV